MEKTKTDVKKQVTNRFANVSKPEIKSKGTSGKLANPKISELVRSASGCSVSQAGMILNNGSKDLWIKADPDGKEARNALRNVWDHIDRKTELCVFTTGEGEQRYFIIAKSEFQQWWNEYADYRPQIDERKKTKNEYTLAELGLE